MPSTLWANLLEVCDAAGKPLLLMPAASVRAQSIPYKKVHVALRDAQKRICLVRLNHDGQWRLPGDCVYANEAAEDAALRVLRSVLGLQEMPMLTRHKNTPAQGLVRPTVFVSSPCVYSVKPDARHIAEILFLDKDEIAGIQKHFAELLQDDLIYALEQSWIF